MQQTRSTNRANSTRKLAAGAAILALWTGAVGCDDVSAQRFREGAVTELQNGVLAVLTGVVNGAFNIIDARGPSDGSDTTTGDTTAGA